MEKQARKRLIGDFEDYKGKIRVYVRVRPTAGKIVDSIGENKLMLYSDNMPDKEFQFS